jgi:hypothetical protein
MKPAFLVTSAIYTDHGVYSATERMAQTIKTFESIKKYCPEADIILLESSARQSIGDKDIVLLNKYTKYIVNFSEDEDVRRIYNMTTNHDIVKNYTELVVLLKTVSNDSMFREYDRIFKISGRYELNDDFHLTDYDSHCPDFIVNTPRSSQFAPSTTGFVMNQCMTRLWSFPGGSIGYVKGMLNTMLLHFIDRVNNKGYIDCEHLLYAHLPRLNTHYVQKIGVEGRIGPNGVFVKD